MSEDLGTNLGGEDTVAEPKPVVTKAPKAAKVAAPKERVRIILEENENIPPTGLFVGLNGRGFLLTAGEEIDVPIGVKEILDNARMLRPVQDPQTQQVVGYREQMRYPYRLVG